MRNWETTMFGVFAAIGGVLQHATGVPHWVNLCGEVLSGAGVAGLGYTAASARGVEKTIAEAPAATPAPPSAPATVNQQPTKP